VSSDQNYVVGKNLCKLKVYNGRSSLVAALTDRINVLNKTKLSTGEVFDLIKKFAVSTTRQYIIISTLTD